MACNSPYLIRHKVTGFIQPVPCGRCEACLKRRSNEWGLRCVHELKVRSAVFITLTYRETDGHLHVEDLQKFFKKVRKQAKVSYLASGEYGKIKARPHFHAIVFYDNDYKGIPIKRVIKQAWIHGNVHVGFASQRSAQYVAKYTTKNYDREFYLVRDQRPPFIVASRGLGLEYARRHIGSWIRNGGINLSGYHFPIPRYYRKVLLFICQQKLYNSRVMHGEEKDMYGEQFNQHELNARSRREIYRGEY